MNTFKTLPELDLSTRFSIAAAAILTTIGLIGGLQSASEENMQHSLQQYAAHNVQQPAKQA